MTAVLLAAAAVSLTGCGPTEYELARAEEEAEDARQDALDNAPVWVGTVMGYDGFIDDLIEIDFGGTYPVEIDLARVQPVDRCDYDAEQDFDAAYTAAIHTFAPIGSKVAVVRSVEGSDYLSRDKGFLHPVDGAGTPMTDGVSLNEQMAIDGIAVPDPTVYVRREYSPVQEEIDRQREWLSPLDFSYWEKIVAGFLAADANRVGHTGACAAHEEQVLIERERDRQEWEEEDRRWRRGPDGREGTRDDYTYGDERDGGGGGGGGSFNVPGGLCPTRWC